MSAIPTSELSSAASLEGADPASDHTVQLAVRGMTCAACVARVERALKKVPGVAQAQVNFATEMATVQWTPQADAPDVGILLATIERAGYHAQVQQADDAVVDDVQPWWHVWGPVLLGLSASLPLMLPMPVCKQHLGDLLRAGDVVHVDAVDIRVVVVAKERERALSLVRVLIDVLDLVL